MSISYSASKNVKYQAVIISYNPKLWDMKIPTSLVHH